MTDFVQYYNWTKLIIYYSVILIGFTLTHQIKRVLSINITWRNILRKLTFIPLGITSEASAYGDFAHVYDVSRKVLGKAVEFLRTSGDQRGAGVLTIMSEKTFPIALRQGFIWGTPATSFKKLSKYAIVSAEKAQRLWLLNAQRGDMTSFQSRNPQARLDDQDEGEPWGQWGGAIVCNTPHKQVLSFSGLPELWDEAAMYVLAVKLGWMSDKNERLQIEAEGNPRIDQLFNVCHWTE